MPPRDGACRAARSCESSRSPAYATRAPSSKHSDQLYNGSPLQRLAMRNGSTAARNAIIENLGSSRKPIRRVFVPGQRSPGSGTPPAGRWPRVRNKYFAGFDTFDVLRRTASLTTQLCVRIVYLMCWRVAATVNLQAVDGFQGLIDTLPPFRVNTHSGGTRHAIQRINSNAEPVVPDNDCPGGRTGVQQHRRG